MRVSVVPRRECAMELLSEVESLCDSLFWDRADVGKRLASLRKLQTAVTCEGAPLSPPFFRRRHESDGAHHLSTACVEELKRHGGVDRLRKALVWDDEEAVDIAASVLASCSGYTARGPGTRTQTFGEHSIAVHETDYVDGGLGWRVWASGVVMCRELLARHGEIGLNGADVLEVGAGCGVVGFLAARLGARRVTFTDYLPGLLSNLDKSVELNAEASVGCELRVRHLEWLASVPGLSEASARPVGGDGSCSGGDAKMLEATARDRSLASDETFAVILGSDVCYEDPLPKALAHTLSRRLARPGVAWLTLPVRDWPGESGEAVIERLVKFATDLGMAVTVEKAPDLEEEEYEGGTFVRHRGGMVHVWLRHE